jgi:hypothetical protein
MGEQHSASRKKRTPKRVSQVHQRRGMWKSINNSSRLPNGETRQEPTVFSDDTRTPHRQALHAQVEPTECNWRPAAVTYAKPS